jgi:hypothetical protein
MIIERVVLSLSAPQDALVYTDLRAKQNCPISRKIGQRLYSRRCSLLQRQQVGDQIGQILRRHLIR